MSVLNEVNPDIEKIEVELLLEGIYRHYGFDYRNYAYSSIKRRIMYRVQVEQLTTISELQAKVLYDRNTLNKLLNDFSINVTEMFRDPSFFKSFRENIIPYIKDLPYIRIWSAGCSTGEEAYSIAIILHEEGLYEKSIIYATDKNENIIEAANNGIFKLQNMQEYTKNYIQSGGMREFSEYYSVRENNVILAPFLKQNIVFAHHNLATDHSFNEFHLILCRNVLIYFNDLLKARAHTLFFESLSPNGILCLGSKESIIHKNTLNSRENYIEIVPKENIYLKSVCGDSKKAEGTRHGKQ